MGHAVGRQHREILRSQKIRIPDLYPVPPTLRKPAEESVEQPLPHGTNRGPMSVGVGHLGGGRKEVEATLGERNASLEDIAPLRVIDFADQVNRKVLERQLCRRLPGLQIDADHIGESPSNVRTDNPFCLHTSDLLFSFKFC